MNNFKIGDRVQRIEDREQTAATVLAVSEDFAYYEIAYDEGGSGWWPESALEGL